MIVFPHAAAISLAMAVAGAHEQSGEAENGAATGAVQVLVHLSDAPAAEVYAAVLARSPLPKERAEAEANAAAQAQLTRIKEAQANLASVLAGPPFRAREIYRVQRTLNAIAVMIDATKLDEVRRLPAVKAVRPLLPADPTSTPDPPHPEK